MLLITVDSSKGIIGAGKTWMTNELSKRIPNSIAFIEHIDERWLKPMYKDFDNGVKPSPAATMFQMWQLGRRQHICQRAIENAWDFNKVSIVDRYLPSDGAFAACMNANGLISDLDYEAYLQAWYSMEKYVLPPHIVIDLRVEPETCIKRISHRKESDSSRESENAITPEYLKHLGMYFDSIVMPWYHKNNSKVITVNWEEFRPIEEIMDLIFEELPILRAFCNHDTVGVL